MKVIPSITQTIIALCTPRGSGALALLRLSGSDARGVAAKIGKLPQNKKIYDALSHTIHYGWVVDQDDNHIDQVLFLVMDGPRTFTGENVVEITCHNNPFLIESIIEEAIKNGARLAQEGEFTRRAFENGKIDLLQAEAINELIQANTQQALKKSLAQMEGSFSSWILEIENKLVKALAFCEASFEFLDEQEEFAPVIENDVTDLLGVIQTLKKTFDVQKQIRQGIRIALIGSVNAGKSSLFNALLGENRAIVTEQAGTTRDVIESGLYRNGTYWTLVDTAGLRQTDDRIEKEGIKRSHEEAQKADIILLVLDSSKNLSDEEQEIYNDIPSKYHDKVIVVASKTDLPQKNTFLISPETLSVSTKNIEQLAALESRIQHKISALLEKADSPFLINERQFKILLGLEQKLNIILTMLQEDIQYELISYHLREALEHLSELTGKSVSEMAMDMVFKQFCVGK